MQSLGTMMSWKRSRACWQVEVAVASLLYSCSHLDDTVKIAELADVSKGECAGLWALRRD